MMDTKLTLSIKPEIVEGIKEVAKAEGKSVSSLVEAFFIQHIQRKKQKIGNPLAEIQALAKGIPLLTDEAFESELAAVRKKKHG